MLKDDDGVNVYRGGGRDGGGGPNVSNLLVVGPGHNFQFVTNG